MKHSESIKEIATALSKCQATLKDVFKGTEGYGYQYAPLDVVYDEVRPKMTECGLSLTHEKSFNKADELVEIRSLLMHTSGEWLEYYGSLPYKKGKNCYQDAGSGFTYIERYQTSAIFAITADEDKDGHGDNAKPPKTEEPPPPPKLTKSDFQAKIENLPTIADIEAWEKAHLPKAESALSKADYGWFVNYIKQVKDGFEPKKTAPEFVVCPQSQKDMPLIECKVAECAATCQVYKEAVK